MYCVVYIIHYMLYYILFILHYIYIYMLCITVLHMYIYIYTVSRYVPERHRWNPRFFRTCILQGCHSGSSPHVPCRFPAGSQAQSLCQLLQRWVCCLWCLGCYQDVTRMTMTGWDYYGITWITTYTWVMLSMFESPGWCLALPKAMNKSAFRWERCWKYVSSRHYSWPKLSCEPGQL